MELEGFKYEIIVSNKATESLLVNIIKYWTYDNNTFTYPINEDISNDGISLAIIQNILKNSKCLLTFKNCILCYSSLTITVINRKDFLDFIALYPRICPNCKKFSPNYSDFHLKDESLDEIIRSLSIDEIKVLKGIIQLRRKDLIYRHIFNNDISDSNVWNIINGLQRKGLIWIEREDNWKIKSFNFSSKIQYIIKKE
ncbi:hypothetical protein [Maribacter sp. Asnod1-A12]|uniref:hypothetical protein n=1 Tax=Maribacter sp. Asnod1-A12 TaxID=3160576 RepID=UPI003868B9FB